MKAACVIVRKGGKYLGVSRKNDHTDFGLPAGKVEKGEREIDAARRELGEETGLEASSLVLIDARTYNGKLTYCFIAEVTGNIETAEAGTVAWVDAETLYVGSFGDYNRVVLGVATRKKEA